MILRTLTVIAVAFTGLMACSSADKSEQELVDAYLWLEEVDSERALDWVAEQNAATEKVLNADPRYSVYRQESLEILTAKDRIPSGSLRGGYVYNFWQDDVNVRGIWRRVSLKEYRTDNPDWQLLLDLDELAKQEKENWVWSARDLRCLPPLYERCMIALSRGGGDANVKREFDARTASFVENGFYLPEAKSGAIWADEDTLMVHTDFGPDSMTDSGYARIVKRWRRGQTLESAETLYEGESSDVWVASSGLYDGEAIISIVRRAITFFEQEMFVVTNDSKLVRLPLPGRATLRGLFSDQLLIQLSEDWQIREKTLTQGSMVSFSLKDFLANEKIGDIYPVFVPTERTSLQSVRTTAGAVLATTLDNVAGKLTAYTFANGTWSGQPVELPGLAMVRLHYDGIAEPVVFASVESFLIPESLYTIDSNSLKAERVKSVPDRFDASGAVVNQYAAVSTDGTKIPYFVVQPADIDLDGTTPTLLYGYGGFQISSTPSYLGPAGKLWLERGGAYVVANIRGGSEFGPAWHQAAVLENKQRSYDDFIAVAEDLIARGITSPQHLGIHGGSNGGLLVGVALTQRPDLFNAVASFVPLLDMLRYTELPPGASWMAEYGDPSDPKMRAIISAYSPYQNISPEAQYPKVLLYTSTRDDRVHPGHARKMAARLIENKHSVYYYENMEGGHSGAANQLQQADQLAMLYVYLAQQLGGDGAD